MKPTLSFGLVVLVALTAAWHLSYGSNDAGWDVSDILERPPGVAPVVDPLYREECGSCHFAYPPGLLPTRSWQALMADLENHFGDNAALDPETQRALSAYLVENSADRAEYRRSRKIIWSLADSAMPLRITDIPYIKHEHDEIPDRMWAKNPQVRSLSNCAACHYNAERGSFSERDIGIPGFGRWDD